jgi:CYTH domain-containing protein
MSSRVAYEVERKFRVHEVPASLGKATRLRQAYLAVDGGVEVRVRDRGGTHVLGVKGGRGIQRTEVEVEIGVADFDELWTLAPDRRIDKTRYRVAVGDHVAEVDVYAGSLQGLVVVEVEFADRGEAEAFVPPPWFGDEVTGDPRWSNAALATSRPPGVRW